MTRFNYYVRWRKTHCKKFVLYPTGVLGTFTATTDRWDRLLPTTQRFPVRKESPTNVFVIANCRWDTTIAVETNLRRYCRGEKIHLQPKINPKNVQNGQNYNSKRRNSGHTQSRNKVLARGLLARAQYYRRQNFSKIRKGLNNFWKTIISKKCG